MDAYIASGNTPIAPEDPWNSPALSDIPVAYQAGASEERRLEQIITQKWLALFPDGWEAYAEYRRTGYPNLYPILNSLSEILDEDDTFNRLSFVDSEYSNNRVATEAARSLLEEGQGVNLGADGLDNNATRVWWDAKP